MDSECTVEEAFIIIAGHGWNVRRVRFVCPLRIRRSFLKEETWDCRSFLRWGGSKVRRNVVVA